MRFAAEQVSRAEQLLIHRAGRVFRPVAQSGRVHVAHVRAPAVVQEPEQPGGDGTSGTTGEGSTGGESTGGSSEPSSSSSTGGGILDWWSSLLG